MFYFILFYFYLYPLSLIFTEISGYIGILLLLRSGDVESNPGPENAPFNFHKKQLSFCHLNVRSLLQQSDIGKRFDHLYNYVCRDNCYDVVALTETHLSQDIDDNEINIENYTLFRIDRNRHGGGIAIYCRSELEPTLISSLNVQGIEIFWIQVTVQKNKILFGTCYRPPNQNADERKIFIDGLHSTFETIIDKIKKPFVLLGDFNDRCNNTWGRDHTDSELKFDLVNLINDFNLSQLIREPTRNNSILDLIISNCPAFIQNSGVDDPISGLDHDYFRSITLYNETNLNQLSENLLHVPWNALMTTSDNIDDMTETFTTLLKDEIKNVIPTKTVLIRPNDKPGMNGHVRKLFRKCHCLHKIAMKSKSEIDSDNHRIARREAKHQWKLAQKEYYGKMNKKMEDPNTRTKTYWKLTKASLGQNKIQNIPTLVANGISYTDDASKVKILNEFFASQPTNTTINFDENELNQNIQGPELSFIPIQREKILEILKSLNVSKACGIDGIGNNVLKKCADSLVEPISIIASASLESGCFPAAWKQANVVPVYKKNDKSCITNYRPISLLPCPSKVVERLVYNELYAYCSKFNLLSEKNSGFKKLDGTINQLINLTNKIYQALNDEHEIAMIFLDLSKAYDRICHTRLIYKLRKIGIKGTLLKWIESYLSDRSQRVVYGGTTSDFIKIFGSVPQGSILSSLLFLIYLIDIEAGIKSDMFMFADDVALMNKFKNKNNLEVEINADLEKLNDWAYTWNMDFNPAKTEMIVFSNKKAKSRPNIFLKDIKINQVATHKHLGIFLSENMKWTTHIDYSVTVNKARKKLGLLRRQSKSLSTKQKIDIYKTMIRPVLEYGSVLFDNCSVCDNLKIESCQRTAALICTGAMRRTETKLLFEYLRWDSLEDRRKISKTSLFHKIIHNQAPLYLSRNITFKQPCTNTHPRKYPNNLLS